jgi:integrative and conjugative element protein (TIGR02256 family)
VEIEYYSWGKLLPSLDPCHLKHQESRYLYAACKKSNDFEILELRQLDNGQASQIIDGIVVDCCDGAVPACNLVGIKSRECLLLVYDPNSSIPYHCIPLRSDFPVTPHQNRVVLDGLDSLCLYAEPWSIVERTWTPEKYLERILWWLRQTALGALHQEDQPLEPLYFESPIKYFLPANFREDAKNNRVFKFEKMSYQNSEKYVIYVISKESEKKCVDFDVLIVEIPPIVSNIIEQHPTTLSMLEEHLIKHNSLFSQPFINAIKSVVQESSGLSIPKDKRHTILVLQVPIKKTQDSEPDRTDIIGFCIENVSLAKIGIECGALLDGKDQKAYRDVAIGNTYIGINDLEEWKNHSIKPITIKIAFTPQNVRKASDVPDKDSEFEGVLAGVGALGSCMAEIWSRIGWGKWSFVDEDLLEPHNLVRHIGKDYQIGWKKVDVLANMVNLIWPTIPIPNAINAKITNFNHEEVKQVISTASLLVDATTTLEAPRDLSDQDKSPRIASVFLSPSDNSSVLLLENKQRTIRANSLEAQYYRAILNTKFGNSHLANLKKNYRTGNSCRDLSHIFSLELVQLHATTLAKQIRLLSAKPTAKILVWLPHENTGNLVRYRIPVKKTMLKEEKNGWRIIWDEGLVIKLQKLRLEFLPNETGGIIVGYFDQKQKAVYVVDVLAAPCDSVTKPDSFIRGKDNLLQRVENIKSKTAAIVDYIGEWHSHPKDTSALPSFADRKLLDELSKRIAKEGLPILMIIVGEKEFSLSLEKVDV